MIKEYLKRFRLGIVILVIGLVFGGIVVVAESQTPRKYFVDINGVVHSAGQVSTNATGSIPTVGGNCPTGSTTSTTADDIGNQILSSGGALGNSISYVCGNLVIQTGNGDGTGSPFSIFSNNDTLGIVQSMFRVQRDGGVRVGNYLAVIPSDGGAPNFSIATGTILPANYGSMIAVQPDIGMGGAGSSNITIFGCQTNVFGGTCGTAATEADMIEGFKAGTCCPLSIANKGYRVTATGIIFEGGTTVVTTQFDKVDATLADVTGLLKPIKAATKYKFNAVLHVNPSAAGGEKFAIASTGTATNIIYQVQCDNASTNAIIPLTSARQTALAGAVGENASGVTSLFCKIEGELLSGTAGSLTVQFAQNSASGTSSVLVGSTFNVQGIF
jgi:hypothetical protein